MADIKRWKFPDGQGSALDSAFDIPVGITNIDIPPNLLQRYRNLNIEFLFSGMTATDENLTVEFYRANNVNSFDAPNIMPVGDNITLTAPIVANPDGVFLREFSNIDTTFFRAVINAPAGVTASLIVSVNMGGLAL